MTLMKSLLLGSAAGIVAVASAHAADLPTRKGPVAAEYVRVCSITVAGKPIVGFVLPGSDTCLKISGYVTGQVEGGNLRQGYALNYNTGVQTPTSTRNRDDFGWTTRANVAVDAVSNTAYGPLAAHVEMQFENGNGFDTDVAGGGAYINLAYVTWAGLTAGKALSFYSFTGGGVAWANFFSPDQRGFNQPDVLAYTASFGGGFSATIAAQSSGANGYNGWSGGGTNIENFTNYGMPANVYLTDQAGGPGMRAPDVVGALSVDQSWGRAQVSGVAHYVRANSAIDTATTNIWGYGIDAGVQFNLPNFGQGDYFLLTGSWTRNAVWYSGIPDGVWGEDGAINGNGQQMAIADIYRNPSLGGWASPTAWSVASAFQHYFSPQFVAALEGSYAQVHWTGTDASSVVSDGESFIVGPVFHWDPVKNLDFEFELLYENTHSDRPAGLAPGTSWEGDADGFASRFMVTRNF